MLTIQLFMTITQIYLIVETLIKINLFILLIIIHITDLILIMLKVLIQIIFGKNLNQLLEKFILQKKKKLMQKI